MTHYVHPPGRDIELLASIFERILMANAGDLSGVESCKHDLDFFFELCESGNTSGYIKDEGPKRTKTGEA